MNKLLVMILISILCTCSKEKVYTAFSVTEAKLYHVTIDSIQQDNYYLLELKGELLKPKEMFRPNRNVISCLIEDSILNFEITDKRNMVVSKNFEPVILPEDNRLEFIF